MGIILAKNLFWLVPNSFLIGSTEDMPSVPGNGFGCNFVVWYKGDSSIIGWLDCSMLDCNSILTSDPEGVAYISPGQSPGMWVGGKIHVFSFTKIPLAFSPDGAGILQRNEADKGESGRGV